MKRRDVMMVGASTVLAHGMTTQMLVVCGAVPTFTNDDSERRRT